MRRLHLWFHESVHPSHGSGGLLVPLFLALMVVISALAVIRVKHENRTLTSEIEKQRVESERLDMEYSQLRLEEAALSHHARIERMAQENLGMTEPRDYVVVGNAP